MMLAAFLLLALGPNDVHLRYGFSCADCHLGDPQGRVKIARTAIPKLCARCHSNAALIHRYNPRQRVDQLAQYVTSVHGKRLAGGDMRVATCTDCHGWHDIRPVRDAHSPVHPLRLPGTCARCHQQIAEYHKSVHWEALSKRGDLSAPSCATCHGNHGATPPQVSSVTAVCGTCHVLFENLFVKSPHQPAFAAMGVAGCITCHGNHEVTRPSREMLASTCTQCHEAGSAGGQAAAQMSALLQKLDAALSRSEAVLARARNSGMEVSEAQLRQIEARENLVKARVAVHAFQTPAVEAPVNDGLKIASQTLRAGEDALRERDRRRLGLALSLFTIVVTMAGLWMAVRHIEGVKS